MKKIIVNATDNVKISQQNVFLSRNAEGESTVGFVLVPGSHHRVHIRGHIKDFQGNDLTTIWSVASKLFSNNVFLRGVDQVADGWQVVLDCTLLSKDLTLRPEDAILVGKAYEPVVLHRVGSDVASNGARIL